MNALTRSFAAGAAGAITTNVLHEITRRSVPNAPRVDLLGMQAVSRMLTVAGFTQPEEQKLYGATLAGDLLSNALYFSAVRAWHEQPIAAGIALGAIAGLGAVVLPEPLGLRAETTSASTQTAMLTAGLYIAGGLAAGLIYGRFRE
jgi:nitric oxide reductase large subunit